ncbi:barstar family protein [Rhodococcus tukisamuensis]|uniref:Barstar (Barnase inhibitor) n=1 Tax=Rhodococcus tukisamuensis TaxID=168276 RepID=A0A1G6T4Z3_9NOCA|nr:barstar family protein [Rhodococcus tukisamuensis]SDD23537.1 Barstar (barnase inhibitor) [Rhodococcus tukisamuensis]
MPRGPVFDPIDRELFDTQRQRFDWSLLQNGSVYRYDTRFGLDCASRRLDELGYLVHRIDLQHSITVTDVHTVLAGALSFPAFYGKNLDAFNDLMYDVGEFRYGSDPDTTGTVLALAGYDTLVNLDRHTADVLLTIFAMHARLAALFSHPMLCIIESTAHDLGPVNGRPVQTGSLWDTPPSSWPITAKEIVEFEFETTNADAAAMIEVIAFTLVERVGGWAKWQILDPVQLDSDDSVEHPAEPQRQRCDVVVSVGIRGEGDLGEIDEDVYVALRDAGLTVGSSTGAGYPFGAERERLLGKYSELRDGHGGGLNLDV